MLITLEIPDIMQASVRGEPVLRDMTALPQSALDHIFKYGFQRVNNDSGAVGKDEDNATAIAKSDKKWDALVAGTIRVQSSRETDPIMARAVDMAIEKVEAALRAKLGLGAKAKLPEEYTAKLIREKAREVVAANPIIREQAKAQIEAEKALEIEIEL